jgi:hypothetical protein
MSNRATHVIDEKRTRDQEKAYRASKVYAAVRALHDIIGTMRPLAPRTYELEPALVARARRIDQEAWAIYQTCDERGWL